MNGTFYSNPTFPSLEEDNTLEERKEKELDNNKGKTIKVYTNYKDEELKGRFEYINNNYLIFSTPETNEYTLIFLKNINYIVFNEEINLE